MFPNVTIPEPTDFFFPRWYTSPLFRGSYSNIPAAFVPAHQQNLRATVEERLWFAGEATSEAFFGRSFFCFVRLELISDRIAHDELSGFLHGAYFEGRDVANTIVNCVESGGCHGLPHIQEILI